MQQQVPTVESLQAQLTQLIVQKAQAKEQIEQIDRILPVINGQLQLLQVQEQAAQEEVTED